MRTGIIIIIAIAVIGFAFWWFIYKPSNAITIITAPSGPCNTANGFAGKINTSGICVPIGPTKPGNGTGASIG